MKKILLTLIVLCLPTLCLATEIIPYPDNVAVSITPIQAKYDNSENILIKVTFTNTSSERVKFLVWGTPFEGRINADIFDVRLENGSPLPYMGRMYKRGKPNAGDYREIGAGKSISAVVDLYDAYDVSVAGDYSLQYTNKGRHGRRSNAALRQSGSAGFVIEDTGKFRTFKQTPDFSNCSSSEQSILDSALTEAEGLIKTAYNDLQSTPVYNRGNATRYIEWFGSYNSYRYNFVLDNFEDLYYAVRTYTMEFDCGCNESAYAYVYPYDPFGIYLCNAFWYAPLTGTDSKAGTLVHELSHFHIVASTYDYAYGHSDAKALAITSPYLAIENADSHEYFAENTPYLDMPTEIPLGEALDNDTLVWTAGGNEPFYGQEDTSKVGGDSAQSGDIGNNQTSSLRTTLPKNSKIDFYWRVSSQANKDYLEFWVNGKLRDKISGDSGWKKKSYLLVNTKSVEWRYKKDASGSSGSDKGWIDNVVVEEVEVNSPSPMLNLLLDDDS